MIDVLHLFAIYTLFEGVMQIVVYCIFDLIDKCFAFACHLFIVRVVLRALMQIDLDLDLGFRGSSSFNTLAAMI